MILPLRLVVFGFALLVASPIAAAERDSLQTPASSAASRPDNAELTRLCDEDQADRQPPAGVAIDWSVVGPRDRARLARVKEFYRTDQIKTGADYYHAALILQHGDVPEDYLLAHEFCVVALSKGHSRALWLAAATEDRFLRNLGRPQRFGTQYLTVEGVTELQETDSEVTDEHRRQMKVPTLAEAKARASRFDRGPKVELKPAPNAPALTQDLFSTADAGADALRKVLRYSPKTEEDVLRLQRACRDLCLRFPAPAVRATAMLTAAMHWFRVSPAMLAELDGWDPAAGERDPEFTPEQRAQIAMRMAGVRASRRLVAGTGTFEELQFEEVAKAAAGHRTTEAARDALVDAALHVAPGEAIPRLREILPDSEPLRRDIIVLEAVGKPLELELGTLDGGTLRLRDLRGKVVLVHFFAQRFSGSTSFMPALQELVEQYGADNLALVGINTDPDIVAARKIVAESGITWPVHHDRSVAGPTVCERFRARILPYYFLIDRAGVLRFRGIQPKAPQTLERVAALVAEPPPPDGR